MAARAESLLKAQQEYFLKNENIPAKSAKYTGIVGTVAWVGFFASVATSMAAHGEPYELASPGSTIILGILGAPIVFVESWVVGGVGGLIFQGKTIKPQHQLDLHKLIFDYNKAVGVKEN